jgi:hypothetical protein
MAFDLSKLARIHEFELETAALGRIQEQKAAPEKRPDERDSDYLLHMVRGYNAAQAARMRKLLGPIHSAFSRPLLSESTLDLLRKNFTLSDRLQNSLAGFRQARHRGLDEGLLRPEPPVPPNIPENPVYETNKQLGDLLSYLDRMEPLVVESGELIRNLNDAAIQMLAGQQGRTLKPALSAIALNRSTRPNRPGQAPRRGRSVSPR